MTERNDLDRFEELVKESTDHCDESQWLKWHDEYKFLKAKIQEQIDFKKRFDENKLLESERFNKCNPNDGEYCLFEQENKELKSVIDEIEKNLLSDYVSKKSIKSILAKLKEKQR